MAGARFAGRSLKRPPLSFSAKVALVILLALSSVAIYSNFSSPVSSRRRSSFGDISVPNTPPPPPIHRKSTASPPPPPSPPPIHTKSSSSATNPLPELAGSENTSVIPLPAAAAVAAEEDYKGAEHEEQGSGDDEDMEGGVEVNPEEDEEEIGTRRKKKKKKELGPVFDPRDRYSWKLCKVRSGDNYVPCIDMEGSRIARNQRSRHRERSCPRTAPMCLVSLPPGYQSPVPWPESESKIWYKNVVHPKLSAFIKTQSWMNLSGDYLMFPQGASEFNRGAQHYLDLVEEMVPDIEWGKNVRVVLDIGCGDASFGATLLHKDVITLSLGLMDDETDLIQLALERGFPAVVGNLGTRRVPFPNGVFDAIHSSDCDMPWHSSGGKLLLEMNRILRPGGYFILSSKHGDVDSEAGMSNLTASICWNILAHKTDEVSEVGIKIYQRPASNDIYELRRKNEPPFCKEDENQAVVWYETIKTCLHKVPAAIEQRGTDWPEEWPKRLDTFPEWLGDLQEKLASDNEHWKAIVSKSYLVGMGVDWSNIRNIMDMKAIYGGFAAAMASEKVWVMNVVPVNAPNTLPIIYERGLIGIYHDWCEPFSTYPRSYDLLHADHLFSRLKNRCKQPVTIVVEMDRILRPGGWAIIRDKLLILNPLETILKSLHWEIRMAYGKDKEGILCAQKTVWRPLAT